MDGSQETSSKARLVHVNLTQTFICSSGFIDCWNKVWNLHFYSFLFFLQKRGDKQRMKPQEEDFFFSKKENTNKKKRKNYLIPAFSFALSFAFSFFILFVFLLLFFFLSLLSFFLLPSIVILQSILTCYRYANNWGGKINSILGCYSRLPITSTPANSNLALTQTKIDLPWISFIHLL